MIALWVFFRPLLLNRYVIGAIVVVAMLSGAYFKGRMDSSANCREATVQAQLDAARIDLTNAEKAATAAQIAQAQAQAEALEAQKEAEDYEREIAKRPNPGCDLTGDDKRRLRKIIEGAPR